MTKDNTPTNVVGETAREIIQYEYRFESTPKYLSEDINEFWEVHKVFHSWLDNGSHNFIVVLRRPLERKL